MKDVARIGWSIGVAAGVIGMLQLGTDGFEMAVVGIGTAGLVFAIPSILRWRRRRDRHADLDAAELRALELGERLRLAEEELSTAMLHTRRLEEERDFDRQLASARKTQ